MTENLSVLGVRFDFGDFKSNIVPYLADPCEQIKRGDCVLVPLNSSLCAPLVPGEVMDVARARTTVGRKTIHSKISRIEYNSLLGVKHA